MKHPSPPRRPSVAAPSSSPLRFRRRSVLQALGGAALALPFVDLLRAGRARADGNGFAQRAIFMYFPDGVSGPSQSGEPSEWHCTGSEHDFTLQSQLQPLSAHKGDCVFLNGVSSGPTDSGSHPGGAKKLLTAVDGGYGQSLDQYLASTVFSASPWRHLYLGAMATQNGASGDKHISYPTAGESVAPEDNPRVAFQRLFGASSPSSGASDPGAVGGAVGAPDPRVSILDVVQADLADLRGRLGGVEQQKLDVHLESVREIEQRIQATPPPAPASCASPSLDYAVDDASLYDPGRFPEVWKAQIDVCVLAMSCGVTRCATLQASHHTSELIMSRFPATEMYDQSFDMRSHQASHYGATHDPSHLEYARFVQQRRWFVSQLSYLLDQLQARPDPGVPGASLLDTSVVLLCSEISDGNTHSHDNLPFLLAGRAGGKFSTGRLLDVGYERHHKLLTSIARACGSDIDGFGQDSGGTLPGLPV